jgi:hypothetical protein
MHQAGGYSIRQDALQESLHTTIQAQQAIGVRLGCQMNSKTQTQNEESRLVREIWHGGQKS